MQLHRIVASSFAVRMSAVHRPSPRMCTIGSRLFSVSAYSGIPSDGKAGTDALGLPLRFVYSSDPDSKVLEIGTFDSAEDIEKGRQLMNHVIVEGKAWPFEPIFETEEAFRGYFLSHAAFVARDVSTGNVLGCFYIKPNFPGRCSHICNGGFIVDAEHRGNRIGTLMGACFLTFARDLGYKAAYFNLVFASNKVSIKLWERLGFQRVAEIPNAARLEGLPDGTLDTAYGYHFDLEQTPMNWDPVGQVGFRPTEGR